ncbi:hypothetical protein [Hymenobacter crusticola]|uniref:Outer membrane protein beta-barrel domain-containing protein n=1 Tax=Hymenobacter crusticola TaxID=1770526 RepID=A0A243WKG2_9BACT|nr:hypothetical protein [Hymenobacter crusticola]OUJ76100.1 hypothetical protein BXP70_02150 [Hymenobacter crusticola]
MLATISRNLFTLAAIFQLSPLTSFAQVSTTPAPRWYIKAAPTLALHYFAVQDYEIGAYLIGGTFSGGYSITPKLTLQTGILHGRGGSLDDNFFDDGTPK